MARAPFKIKKLFIKLHIKYSNNHFYDPFSLAQKSTRVPEAIFVFQLISVGKTITAHFYF